jgi:peptidoglycan/LPS O-acetylase OafA/YrhL
LAFLTGFSATTVRGYLFGLLALLSVLTLTNINIPPLLVSLGDMPGSFLPYWYLFFTGVLLNWTLTTSISRIWLAGFLLMLVILVQIGSDSTLLHRSDISPQFSVLLACGIYGVGVMGLLERGLNVAWLSYLGRISYSLYLVHVTIGYNMIVFGETFYNDSALMPVPLTLCAFVASFLAAHILYVTVEQPSLDASKKLKGMVFKRGS